MCGIQKEKSYDMKMKHLEYLQNVISRMANNSTNAKNYCMTVVAAMIGLSTSVENPRVLIYSIPIVLLFSIIDIQYLVLEKGFREKYDLVRKSEFDAESSFDISISLSKNKLKTTLHTYFSWSVFMFYGTIIAVLIGLSLSFQGSKV